MSADPEKYLAAATVMVQRGAGYDEENGNWFYVKYAADGTIDKNPKGMILAGRVAKSMDNGCIACHKKAGGNDYVFMNDQSDQRIVPGSLNRSPTGRSVIGEFRCLSPKCAVAASQFSSCPWGGRVIVYSIY